MPARCVFERQLSIEASSIDKLAIDIDPGRVDHFDRRGTRHHHHSHNPASDAHLDRILITVGQHQL